MTEQLAIVLFDCNSKHWLSPEAKLSLPDIFQAIKLFVSMFVCQSSKNILEFVCYDSAGTYHTLSQDQFLHLRSDIKELLKKLSQEVEALFRAKVEDLGTSKFLRAIGLALCASNKSRNQCKNHRILIVNSSGLRSNDALIWPTIESAVKLNLRIDVISVVPEVNTLKYFTDATKGIYRDVTSLQTLNQQLCLEFILDRVGREVFFVNQNIEIKYECDCVCCKKPRKLVMVCSRCLATFCANAKLHKWQECKLCGAKFE